MYSQQENEMRTALAKRRATVKWTRATRSFCSMNRGKERPLGKNKCATLNSGLAVEPGCQKQSGPHHQASVDDTLIKNAGEVALDRLDGACDAKRRWEGSWFPMPKRRVAPLCPRQNTQKRRNGDILPQQVAKPRESNWL